MKIFILWLIELIIEFSMFHLWWVKVYMYERKSNMTKIKLIKDSCDFFRYLCHQKRSDETEKDKRRISLYFIEGLIIIVMGMGVIPFVFAFVFARAGVILQIIFILFFSGVQYDVLKKWPIAKEID